MTTEADATKYEVMNTRHIINLDKETFEGHPQYQQMITCRRRYLQPTDHKQIKAQQNSNTALL